jgi:hypothetical protein
MNNEWEMYHLGLLCMADRRVAAARSRLDQAAFAPEWAAGQAMTLERAVAVALEETWW